MSSSPLTIVAAVGGAAIATAIGVNVILWEDEAGKSPVPETTAASDKAPAQTAKAAKTASEGLPAFDVVRVGPNGDTVIAGRAKPGSTVVILDNGKAIGQVVADGRGEWVFVPEKPLAAGNRKLSLKMILPGGDGVISDDVVVLMVPAPRHTCSSLMQKACWCTKVQSAMINATKRVRKRKPMSCGRLIS